MAQDYSLTINDNITWDEFLEIGEELIDSSIKLLSYDNKFLRILMQSSGRLYYDINGLREKKEILDIIISIIN